MDALKDKLISQRDIDWLKKISGNSGLMDSNGNTCEEIDNSYEILFKLCSNINNPTWRPSSIIELYFSGKDPKGKKEETLRKKLFLSFEELIKKDFINTIKPAEYSKFESQDLNDIHGRTNLYYPTAKGLLSCFIMTTYPFIHGIHAGSITFETPISFFLVDLFKTQSQIRTLLNRKAEKNLSANMFRDYILDEANSLTGNQLNKLCNLVSPTLYYLNEHYNFFMLFNALSGMYSDDVDARKAIEHAKSQRDHFAKMLAKSGDKNQTDDIHLFI